MVPLVPRPARLEPFFLDNRQRLVERIDQRGRHRVVILAPHPVVLEQLQVEVEAAALHAPLERARPEHHRRQAGRARRGTSACSCRQASMPQRVDLERMSAERGDSVDHHQRVVLAGDRRQLACTGLSTPVEVSACTTATMSTGALRQRGPQRVPDRRRVPTPRRAASPWRRSARTSGPADRRSSRRRRPARACPARPGWRRSLPCPRSRCRRPRTRTTPPARGTPAAAVPAHRPAAPASAGRDG